MFTYEIEEGREAPLKRSCIKRSKQSYVNLRYFYKINTSGFFLKTSFQKNSQKKSLGDIKNKIPI